MQEGYSPWFRGSTHARYNSTWLLDSWINSQLVHFKWILKKHCSDNVVLDNLIKHYCWPCVTGCEKVLRLHRAIWLVNLVRFASPTAGLGGGWGCEVSCGGHHRPRGKTTTGLALDGAVFDIAQILAYLVHNMSRSQLYLGFGHFVWLPSFFGQ